MGYPFLDSPVGNKVEEVLYQAMMGVPPQGQVQPLSPYPNLAPQQIIEPKTLPKTEEVQPVQPAQPAGMTDNDMNVLWETYKKIYQDPNLKQDMGKYKRAAIATAIGNIAKNLIQRPYANRGARFTPSQNPWMDRYYSTLEENRQRNEKLNTIMLQEVARQLAQQREFGQQEKMVGVETGAKKELIGVETGAKKELIGTQTEATKQLNEQEFGFKSQLLGEEYGFKDEMARKAFEHDINTLGIKNKYEMDQLIEKYKQEGALMDKQGAQKLQQIGAEGVESLKEIRARGAEDRLTERVQGEEQRKTYDQLYPGGKPQTGAEKTAITLFNYDKNGQITGVNRNIPQRELAEYVTIISQHVPEAEKEYRRLTKSGTQNLSRADQEIIVTKYWRDPRAKPFLPPVEGDVPEKMENKWQFWQNPPENQTPTTTPSVDQRGTSKIDQNRSLLDDMMKK